MSADASLRYPRVCIITGIQNPLLDVTENVLHRVVVGTPLGQTGPAQVQRAHQPTRLLSLTRVRRVAVQGNPDFLAAIPAPHAAHKLTDELRPLARKECPPCPAMVYLIKREQVKAPSGLLVAGQYQAALPRVASSAIGLDRDGLDIEENEDPATRAMPPLETEAAADGRALGVVAEELPPEPAQVEAPFLSTRRRCSRLMA